MADRHNTDEVVIEIELVPNTPEPERKPQPERKPAAKKPVPERRPEPAGRTDAAPKAERVPQKPEEPMEIVIEGEKHVGRRTLTAEEAELEEAVRKIKAAARERRLRKTAEIKTAEVRRKAEELARQQGQVRPEPPAEESEAAAKPEKQPVSAAERESFRTGVIEKTPVHITEPGRLPLSVSIETEGGLVSRIAEIGDVLPVKCTREFSTENTSVRAVALNLYAGERPMAAQNHLIAKFKITGIEKLPVGRPVITVVFEIGRDCSISVDAMDEGSLRRCTKTIGGSWKPSAEEIRQMVQEAQDHLQEDNKIRERSRLLRNARECLFRADTRMKTRKKEMSGETRRAIREKSKRLRQRLKKFRVPDMSELDEKAITDAVNSLDNTLRS